MSTTYEVIVLVEMVHNVTAESPEEALAYVKEEPLDGWDEAIPVHYRVQEP